MKTYLIFAAVMLLLSVATELRCQEVRPFITKSTGVLLIADAGAKAADFYFTMRLTVPKYTYACGDIPGKGHECWPTTVTHLQELDPIARPFVTHGRPLAAAYFATSFGIDTFAAYELHKHRGNRWAQGLLLIGIGDNVAGAVHSAH
jgi:hypothetical protein